MSSLIKYPDSRVVSTAYGKVQGRRLIHAGDKQVDAFQGIPYAAPPIGELRFEKPQPPCPWDGVKETKEFGPRAIQPCPHSMDFKMKKAPSEDCLYLNVFTPCWEPPEKGFPVMLFIHGGGFELGESRDYGDVNICEQIVSRGIVFITIHYRLGYLGFFTTGDDACRGNFGLWDQSAALKWVQQNIAAFGGDKDNVTVIGQSAGAASADLLHLSPHSTNLFHKMICMSGAAECRWANTQSMPVHCRKRAVRLGVTDFSDSEKVLADLRKLPAISFVTNSMDSDKDDDVDIETGPYVDGDFLPNSLDELRVKAKPKAILAGVTKEEGLFFMLGMGINEATRETVIRSAIHEAEDEEKLAAEIHRRFITDNKSNAPLGRKIANIASDYHINLGTLELCRKTVAIQEEPVYLYSFVHWNPDTLDVTHACELYYLFKKPVLSEKIALNDKDRRVSALFTTTLTNFAKFGNPNGARPDRSDLSVPWIAVSSENHERNFVFTSGSPEMKEQLFEGRTAAFILLVDQHRPSHDKKFL